MNTSFTPAKVDCAAGNAGRKLEAHPQFFCVRAMTGSVESRINGGEWFPLIVGDYMRALSGQTFASLEFRSAAGGSVTLLYGNGELLSLSTATGGSTVQVYTGAFANPNGNVVPADNTKGAIYYDDTANPGVWAWSVANTNWVQIA